MARPYANPNCPHCKGQGFIYGASMLDGGYDCECSFDYQRLKNMERIWKSLSEAKEIPNLRKNPPLQGLTNRDLWITAQKETFKAHLKAVCFNMPVLWDARVFSDKDIAGAWLNPRRAQGHKIFDTELESVTIQAMDIDELVQPFEFVVLLLGVKTAPNKEMPNLLLEALNIRRHINRPTWIVDQPDRRIDDMAHLAYSETLEGMLLHWPHLQIMGPNVRSVREIEEELESNAVAGTDLEQVVDVPKTPAETQIAEALSDLEDEESDEVIEESSSLLDSLAENEEVQAKEAARKRWKAKRGGTSR